MWPAFTKQLGAGGLHHTALAFREPCRDAAARSELGRLSGSPLYILNPTLSGFKGALKRQDLELSPDELGFAGDFCCRRSAKSSCNCLGGLNPVNWIRWSESREQFVFMRGCCYILKSYQTSVENTTSHPCWRLEGNVEITECHSGWKILIAKAREKNHHSKVVGVRTVRSTTMWVKKIFWNRWYQQLKLVIWGMVYYSFAHMGKYSGEKLCPKR